MDGDTAMPNGEGLWPIVCVLAPLQGHVIGSGPNHSPKDQNGLKVGDQAWGNATGLAQSGGQGKATEYGQGNEKSIPAQRKGAQLENQGPRRSKCKGRNQMPSAA